MASKSDSVSVIIPTFNRAHCVSRAINSALDQSQRCHEVIVVDDGSSDDTPEVLRTYGDRIRVLRQSNGGVSRARNAGIQAASGEWIAFLDSDDEWNADKIALQLSDVAGNSQIVLHGCNAVFVGRAGENGIAGDMFSARERAREISTMTVIDRPLVWALDAILVTPGVLVRRTAAIDARGFDPQLDMFGDLDFLCRVSQYGMWCISRKALVRVHRCGNAGESLSEKSAARKGHAADSLVRVYSRLLALEWLNGVEREVIRRRLSAVRAELAGIERSTIGVNRSIRTLMRSVLDRPGPTSIVRAVAGLLAGEAGMAWLHRLKGRAAAKRDQTSAE